MTQPYEIRAYEHTYRKGQPTHDRIIFSLYVRDLPGNTHRYVASMALLLQLGFDQGTIRSDRFTRVVVVNDDGSTYEP